MVFPLLLAACNLYPARPPQPALHDFGPTPALAPLSMTSPPRPEEEAGKVAVALVNVDAPAWLRDDRLHYRLLHADPTLVRFYARDAWLAPPPALLAQRLRAAMDGSRYRLRLTLTDFEQVFDSPASAHIVLNFRASAESPDGKSAAERLFQYTHPCPSANAKGAVDAYAAAVEEAVREVRQWLQALP